MLRKVGISVFALTVALLAFIVIGSGYANNTAWGYHLPFEFGVSSQVLAIDDCQAGGCTSANHMNQVDFKIQGSVGDVVAAARGGQVVFVKDSSNIGGCDYALWKYANMIVIKHAPNEFSWYVHLETNSALVSMGDWVQTGQPIGTIGMTGNTCEKHLHFMVSSSHMAWTNPSIASEAPWAVGIKPVNFHEARWTYLYFAKTYISQNQEWQGEKVTLWSDPGYDGVRLWEGSMGFNNGPDGRGFSLQIPYGWSTIVYAYDNRQGGGTCLDQTVWDLEDIWWQNSIRSIEVFNYDNCQ